MKRSNPSSDIVDPSEESPEVQEEMLEELLEFMTLDEAYAFFKEFEEDARGFIGVVRLAMDGGVGQPGCVTPCIPYAAPHVRLALSGWPYSPVK